MENLLDALTSVVNDLVEARVDAVLEARLGTIVEQAVADVPEFDIYDYTIDINQIASEAAEAVLRNATFSVEVD
jgi:hypothetical protein